MGLLGRLLLGGGTLKPEMRETLEAEGLVLVEEGLSATIGYKRFKAPGRRFNGKVVAERVGLGISEERFVLQCRSGAAKLANSPVTSPHLAALDVSLDERERVALHIDYDKLDDEKVSGEVTIRVRTPNAARIVDELNARIRPGATAF